MNPLWIIALLSAGVYAIAKTSAIVGLATTAKQLSVRILSIDSLKNVAGALELSFSIGIDNPTNRSLTIKQPYIRVLMNGKEVAHSSATGEMKKIKANDKTTLKDLTIGLPFSSIPTILIALLQNKKTGTLIRLEVRIEVEGIRVTDAKEYKLDDLISRFSA